MNPIPYVQAAEGLRNLSQDELIATTARLAREERRITLEILHHLREVERRRAFAKLGYASLWEYATKELKYSESSAYRRISAMRALADHPELEEKIQAGTISLTAVSQVQTFIRAEQYQANKVYSPSAKRELFEKCSNKSTRDVTRELITISPLAFQVQKERVLSEDRTQISFVVESVLLGKIHRVRDLSASRLKDPASYPELMDLMSDVTLDKIDPLRKTVRPQKPDSNVAPIAPKATDKNGHPSRYIPASTRAQIWRESGGLCTYANPETGARCTSTFGLEIEHCKPHSLGGASSDVNNLRLLCKAHNQWNAIQTYGLPKMEPYLNPTLPKPQ